MNIYNLPIVNNYKYLGIFMDNNVNFKENTQQIIKKMIKNEKILKTQKLYNNKKEYLSQLYKTFVLPHTLYGNSIYYPLMYDK